jgi:hypothetical protein
MQPVKPMRRPVLRLALAMLSLAALATACGPSSSSPEASAVPTTAPGPTTATTGGGAASLADCPFSGTLEASQGSGQPNAAIAAVQPSRDGCIDNITIQFATLPPSWTVSYASGPVTDAATGKPVTAPGPEKLVVTFLSTTFADGKTPATISSGSLDYVDDISVASGPNGSLQFVISLGERAQYTTSVSRVPSNVVLAIG